MGNWMTINMKGNCSADEVAALRDAAAFDWDKSVHDGGPLSIWKGSAGSLCGIDDWPAARIDVIGNCAERDFTPECVAEQLRHLVKAAPSLELVVHCGGEYESLECVATVRCTGGEVTLGKPEIGRLHGIAESSMAGRLAKLMGRAP